MLPNRYDVMCFCEDVKRVLVIFIILRIRKLKWSRRGISLLESIYDDRFDDTWLEQNTKDSSVVTVTEKRSGERWPSIKNTGESGKVAGYKQKLHKICVSGSR